MKLKNCSWIRPTSFRSWRSSWWIWNKFWQYQLEFVYFKCDFLRVFSICIAVGLHQYHLGSAASHHNIDPRWCNCATVEKQCDGIIHICCIREWHIYLDSRCSPTPSSGRHGVNVFPEDSSWLHAMVKSQCTIRFLKIVSWLQMCQTYPSSQRHSPNVV